MTDDWGLTPLMTRIYRQRGVNNKDELCLALTNLLPFEQLLNIAAAAELVGTAIKNQENFMIVGDFDADGATSTALAVAALRKLGAQQVDYLIPSRFNAGYGLSPELVTVAHQRQAQLMITVDNGITSHAGVACAKNYGIKVLITDHHLTGTTLPDADVIVNPNQPHDQFASKNLAGVGVIFYVLLAVRRYLQTIGWFDNAPPSMSEFLDLVALGTVADVVPLDYNNRILVAQGLRRIRAGLARPGIQALLQIAQRSPSNITASDLSFAVAPRLNAAGRLEEMSQGVACLLSHDFDEALVLASQLDKLNQERRAIEVTMLNDAQTHLAEIDLTTLPAGICLYQANWHQGVIGILAGRLKTLYHRPTIIFANSDDATLKGSARSIPALHMRDLLTAIDSAHPQLIEKFGGHAMAAGLTLKRKNFMHFQQIYIETITQQITAAQLNPVLMTDGELSAPELTLTNALAIREGGPWGQNFSEPLFNGTFTVVTQSLFHDKHWRLLLKPLDHAQTIEAVWFNCTAILRAEMALSYRLSVDYFGKVPKLKLLVEQALS